MDNGFPVTVVMATRNRYKRVLETLGRLSELPEQPPVIVVDNNSTDGTTVAVRETFPSVRVLRLSANRGAAARNTGVHAARTPIVAFCDDDSWWAEGTLATADDLFLRHPSLGLIAAQILVGPEQRLDPTCTQMNAVASGDCLPGNPVAGFVACGAVVRRNAFLEAGGFNPRYGIGGEERLLALDMLRRGWALRYVQDVVCHHHPSLVGDREDRTVLVTRNDLWTAWLRHRARRALHETWSTYRWAIRRPEGRRALAEAISGAPWILAQRSPLGSHLERYVDSLAGPRDSRSPRP